MKQLVTAELKIIEDIKTKLDKVFHDGYTLDNSHVLVDLVRIFVTASVWIEE